MSDALQPCPSPEDLEALAAMQDVAPEIEAHVAACATCRAAVQRIRDDNAYLASFRVAGGWPGTAEPELLAELSIPGYDVICELHRGGQGVVFQAIQRSTRRTVALKVVRHGLLASAADRSRFTREIETLARLNHPNIVTVHDAGVVQGLHYFVMDYIDGLPLDEAVQAMAAQRGDAERPESRGPRFAPVLQLFVKICDAVHAAHLRGIMHRDLKPSNVRVDHAGQPHVLDFGLAKSIDPPEVAMTMTGQFVGSLPWASPEQVEGVPSRVDLRTDVYSLGAILFQLLTGDTPFAPGSSLRDTVEKILHRQPPRPSVVAVAQGVHIDDELETIVLKCLAKERERRYQSVDELSRDLRHYLAGEAIDAKRDSAWYVLRKTAWRKRRVFIAVAVPMVLFPFALYAFHRSTLATRQAELERNLRQVEAGRNRAMLEISRRLQARPGSAADSPGGRLSLMDIDAIWNDLDAGSLSVSDHGVALLARRDAA